MNKEQLLEKQDRLFLAMEKRTIEIWKEQDTLKGNNKSSLSTTQVLRDKLRWYNIRLENLQKKIQSIKFP